MEISFYFKCFFSFILYCHVIYIQQVALQRKENLKSEEKTCVKSNAVNKLGKIYKQWLDKTNHDDRTIVGVVLKAFNLTHIDYQAFKQLSLL